MTALPLTHHEPRPDSQPENHTRARQRSDRRIAWGLGLALFGLIMLVWNPTFHSSDGLSMYLVADSLVPVSYTHLTLPTTKALCRSRWSPYH